jgi:cytochrome c oxidase subunit 2
MKKRRMGTRTRGAFLVLSALLIFTVSGCTPDMESFQTVTDRGDKVAWLLNLSFILSFIVMAIVFGVLIYAMFKFRNRVPSEREGNTKLEIFWTATPAVLLAVLFVLSTQAMNAISKDNGDKPGALVVEVTGNQWWWSYTYPSLGITTANEVHVPIDTPIKFELKSNDVIHSFWVPQLGWKMDTIPGRTVNMNFTVNSAGNFDGTCTEFCGAEHAWMRIKVVASPVADFNTWAAAQAKPAAEPSNLLAKDGESTFLAQSCAACHTVSGTSAQGKVGPDLTHFGSRTTLGSGVRTNTPQNLEDWIKDPKSMKPGVLMPAYGQLSEDQIRALVEYLEGLK